jgi:hypothetical protein
MSYFRASTDNPNGWRPGIARMGYLSSGRHRGPDWKDVAAQHDAATRVQQQHRGAVQRATAIRASQVDAYARGDRTRVIYRGLSGLGMTAIDLSGPMTPGAQYVFHFAVTGTVLGGASSIDPQSIAAAVATDSNFSSPSAFTEGTGFQVAFTYTGAGSNVAGAASEMQGVINSHTFNGLGVLANAAFIAAEGGPSGQPLMTQSNPVTTPGQQPPPPSNFNFGTFLSGLGVGGAVALGLGVFLVLKS